MCFPAQTQGQTQDNLSEAQRLDNQVLTARALLSDIGPVSRSAVNAVRMIDFLRSRYAAYWSFGPPLVAIDPILGEGEPAEQSGIGVGTASHATTESTIDTPPDLLSFLAPMPDDLFNQQAWQMAPDNQEAWPSVGNVFEAGIDWQGQLEALVRSVGGAPNAMAME
jgi:hypothetical protein